MTGPELRGILEEADVTNAELARRLDCTPVTVSRWLSGARRISFATALAIMAVLQPELDSIPVA